MSRIPDLSRRRALAGGLAVLTAVELDETPVRIAAYGDEAAALWNFGITPVALFHYMDPAQDPMYAEDAGLYTVIPQDDPAMAYYQELGVRFPDTGGKGDYYWEILSWENSDKYDADIVLNSARGSYSTEQLYMGELAGWLTSDEDVAS